MHLLHLIISVAQNAYFPKKVKCGRDEIFMLYYLINKTAKKNSTCFFGQIFTWMNLPLKFSLIHNLM
jgi:hypothetical protein